MRAQLIIVSSCLALCGCGPTAAPGGDGAVPDSAATPDAGGGEATDLGAGVLDAGVWTCSTSADCDDHLYCNGAETCSPGTPGADARGCRAAAAGPCVGGLTCDETRDRCTTTTCATPDADGDGHESVACGGDDCDDTRAEVHPGATEVPGDGVDENCDGSEDCYLDEDGDGARGTGTTSTTDVACALVDHRLATAALDCCDLDAMAYPGVTAWFTTPDACGSYDYDCSGTEDPQYGVVPAVDCSTLDPCVLGTGAGWSGSMPACGATGTRAFGCHARVVCPPTCARMGLSCPDACGGLVCLSATPATETAACH